VRKRIEYRFRVSSAAVFTLYSYSKALEYHLEYATADSLRLSPTDATSQHPNPKYLLHAALLVKKHRPTDDANGRPILGGTRCGTQKRVAMHAVSGSVTPVKLNAAMHFALVVGESSF
jgi:hypothetical protein